MKIALAQINSTVGDLKGNKEKILSFIEKARCQESDLVIFPELAVCGYPPEDLLLKDYFVRDNIKILNSIAQAAKGLSAIIGFVDKKDNMLYNAAAVIVNGKIIGRYYKQKLPNYGVFDEKRYFKKGQSELIFDIKGKKVGVSICEDIWVEDGVCELQAKQGADILVNLSSSPFDTTKLQERQRILKEKAIKTKKKILYVNMVGGQDELIFDGRSFVFDEKGRVIASARQFEEDLLVVDISPKAKKARIEPAFKETESIYKALVLGTRDYVEKNGFSKVVLGLSGGIDSAVVACVAVEAVGKDNVVGVSMPSQFSSKETQADAKNLARNLHIKFIELPIEPIYRSYEQALSKEFKGIKADIAEENIQARVRGNLIMALSNKFGWLVLTTGNKSEVAVGYCTLYGDMSGGFAVIKDVPKTKVYQLAQFINKKGKKIPPTTILRAPTAELRENQKDQDSLPAYDELDDMLLDYIEYHKSFSQIAGKHKPELVKKVIKLVDLNEYKRRQSAPGIKITPRAFGRDWRLPITNKYKEF